MSESTLVARMSRAFAVCCMLIALFVVVGCGDDNSDTETGKGAAPGATGEEAGGFAVEAGKQRDPKDVAEEKKNFSSEPPPIQILTGEDTGYRVNGPTVVVAQSKSEFKKMVKTHFSHGVKRQDIVPIDYSTRQLVGLFLPQSKPGVLIVITDISEVDARIVVKATRLLPGKGCKTGGKRLHPFHIVETRKMKGTPKPVIVDQRASPC